MHPAFAGALVRQHNQELVARAGPRRVDAAWRDVAELRRRLTLRRVRRALGAVLLDMGVHLMTAAT